MEGDKSVALMVGVVEDREASPKRGELRKNSIQGRVGESPPGRGNTSAKALGQE